MEKGGGLVPVLCAEMTIGIRKPSANRMARRDRHKAPTHPPIRPLSLQNRGPSDTLLDIHIHHVVTIVATSIRN